MILCTMWALNKIKETKIKLILFFLNTCAFKTFMYFEWSVLIPVYFPIAQDIWCYCNESMSLICRLTFKYRESLLLDSKQTALCPEVDNVCSSEAIHCIDIFEKIVQNKRQAVLSLTGCAEKRVIHRNFSLICDSH